MIKSIYEECLLYVKLKPVKNTACFIYCILSSFSVFFDKKKPVEVISNWIPKSIFYMLFCFESNIEKFHHS